MDDLQHELDAVERRARRYWFEDGLTEIFSGTICFVLALYFAVQPALERRIHGAVVNGLLPVLIIVAAFYGRHVLSLAKDRYVHPRTGYIAFRQPSNAYRWLTAALAFVISVLAALLFARAPTLLQWLPALQGLVFGILFLSLGRRTGMMRFPLEGLITAVSGFALSASGIGEHLAKPALFGVIGVILTAGGVTSFAAYMRRTRRRGDA